MTLDRQLKKMGPTVIRVYIPAQKENYLSLQCMSMIPCLPQKVVRMEAVKKAISAQFEVKDLRELLYILGVTVKQNPEEKSITMLQVYWRSMV